MSKQPENSSAGLEPTRRFSNRVAYYTRSRPKYPPAVLNFLREKLNLKPEHVIADVGSGTGFLTQLFIENKNIVYAVEPNAAMRQAAEQLLAGRPNFKSIDATAEATTLATASVNFVVAGQAFHWFDPPSARREFHRILAPGGWVALVWNERKHDSTGFNSAYDKIIHEFHSDSMVDHHQTVTRENSAILPDFFAPSKFETTSFGNVQELDRQGLQARALSSSYMPLPGQPGCAEMLQQLDEAFDLHQQGNRVRIDYDAKVYYGRLD